MRIAVIGVPWNSSGGIVGEANAPRSLRRAGLMALLAGRANVVDYGDVVFTPPKPERDPQTGIIGPRELAEMTLATRAATARALADNRLPLVIGGDCALLLGCLAAARDTFGRVGLMLIDGHQDSYAPNASPTGEVADMELGLALGHDLPEGLPELTGHLPVVAAEDVVVIGARDRQTLIEEGVASLGGELAVFDDASVRASGVAATIADWTARLAGSPGRWWFHLDLDALATEAMPAVSYQQAGGFDWKETAEIATHALSAPGCVGWTLSDYNPDLDSTGTLARRIVEFLTATVSAAASSR
jgi:arginase